MGEVFRLSERQFSRLTPLLPTDTRGKSRVDDVRVISGIVHVLKSGGRWRPGFSPVLYRGRNAIERTFHRLKDYRRGLSGILCAGP